MIIKITIDRFEGNEAILKTEDNETVVWPRGKLPENSLEGTVLMFAVTNSGKTTEDDKKLAKDILNEILHPSD